MMGDAVICTGYLRKSPPEKKLTMATWQRRYFVLRENKSLDYFRSEKDKKPIKVIDLRHCKSIEAGLYHKSFKHVFSIKTSERLYYLVAESSHDMEMWVECLCKACGFSKLEERNSPEFFKRKPQLSSSYGRSSPLSATYPAGSPSQMSSRMSSVSPGSTGFCPVQRLSSEVKPRSSSDPPETVDMRGFTVPSRRNMSLTPDLIQAQLSHSPLLSQSYDTVPAPRPSSQDVYNVVPPPREDPNSRNSGQDYDKVPPPRPDARCGDYVGLSSVQPQQASARSTSDVYDVPRRQSSADQDYDVPPLRPSQLNVTPAYPYQQGSNAVSPTTGSNHWQMMEKQGTYDVLPSPRGVSSGQETYDVVPPLRASWSDQDIYDVLPSPRGISEDQGNYDVVPPLRKPDANGALLSPHRITSGREDYDVVPLPRKASLEPQEIYDMLPSPRQRLSLGQETYDVVPPPRGVSSEQETYDVVPPPHGVSSEQETYDVVPPPRGISSAEEDYDVVPPPRGVTSEQETYDVLPPPRGVTPDQETYDILPCQRPPSQALYDVVPTPRRSSPASETPRQQLSVTEQNAATPSAVLKDPPQEIYDVVPPPKPSPYKGNVYDIVPSPNGRSVMDPSQGSNWNSPSTQCPLNSKDEGYNQPLPSVPSEEESRDSGVYGSGDIYHSTPTSGLGDGHEVQQNSSGHQGTTVQGPVVNRSKKPPPEVNRNIKPATTKDHSYCNMPPPVNRGTKPRQPLPNVNPYENCPNKPKTLERVMSFPMNAPCQNAHVTNPEPDDESYCRMEPRRMENTRCYSFSKKPVETDVSYEEMAPLPVISRNSTSSSSSSYCEDDEETYTAMFPPEAGPPANVSKHQHKKDLQYAEVQLVGGSPGNRRVQRERPSTHYTCISEDATQALRQTCHARKEHLNN